MQCGLGAFAFNKTWRKTPIQFVNERDAKGYVHVQLVFPFTQFLGGRYLAASFVLDSPFVAVSVLSGTIYLRRRSMAEAEAGLRGCEAAAAKTLATRMKEGG